MKKLLAISFACSLVALAVGCFVVSNPPPEEPAPAATTPATAAPAASTPAATSTGPSMGVPKIYGDKSEDAGATD